MARFTVTALALRPSARPFSGFQISGFTDTLRAYLLPFGVYADLAQKLACSVLADFCPVDIEEDGECAAPFRCIVVFILFHDYMGFGLLNGDSEA